MTMARNYGAQWFLRRSPTSVLFQAALIVGLVLRQEVRSPVWRAMTFASRRTAFPE